MTIMKKEEHMTQEQRDILATGSFNSWLEASETPGWEGVEDRGLCFHILKAFPGRGCLYSGIDVFIELPL